MPGLDDLAERIRDRALAMVRTPDGGVRVEDCLTALAAAAGEAGWPVTTTVPEADQPRVLPLRAVRAG